jgi:hypothetical protein
MGRAKRLHKQAVIEGKESAFRGNLWNICKLCGDSIPNNKARQHIRTCWQYPIDDVAPLPAEPIVYRDGKLQPDWKKFRKVKP